MCHGRTSAPSGADRGDEMTLSCFSSPRSLLDASRALSARPGRLRHGHLGVHARRSGAGHRLGPRCHRRHGRPAHLGVRAGDGHRRAADGRARPQPARTLQPARLRAAVRGGPRGGRQRLRLPGAVRDPDGGGARERRVPRRGADDGRHTGAARPQGPGARRAAVGHDGGHRRRRSGGGAARHPARLAGHVLGRGRAVPARGRRHPQGDPGACGGGRRDRCAAAGTGAAAPPTAAAGHAARRAGERGDVRELHLPRARGDRRRRAGRAVGLRRPGAVRRRFLRRGGRRRAPGGPAARPGARGRRPAAARRLAGAGAAGPPAGRAARPGVHAGRAVLRAGRHPDHPGPLRGRRGPDHGRFLRDGGAQRGRRRGSPRRRDRPHRHAGRHRPAVGERGAGRRRPGRRGPRARRTGGRLRSAVRQGAVSALRHCSSRDRHGRPEPVTGRGARSGLSGTTSTPHGRAPRGPRRFKSCPLRCAERLTKMDGGIACRSPTG
ncbi:hypothetical protein SGPA1_21498 [Streptomyces misionensis JCM 4497]